MTGLHHIPLVAAIEIRPPSPDARGTFEREQIARLGALVAEDLAAVVGEVTRGRLIVGPALLEPAQVINPEFAPFPTLERLAALRPGFEPGVTSIGLHRGRAPGEALLPHEFPPAGLFTCLPLVLAVEVAADDPVHAKLERLLFERGGLGPTAMAVLAEVTGLEPVHGQLMTLGDLLALFKVQFAGAGLDPFWPPVEHAVLNPETPALLALPAGVSAEWNPSARGWALTFVGLDEAGADDRSWVLWLRALRQTAAMLESCLLRWRPVAASPDTHLDDDGRWAQRCLGADPGGPRIVRIEHDEVGLLGYSATVDGRRRAWYPLAAAAIGALEARLRALGVDVIDVSSDLEGLRPAG